MNGLGAEMMKKLPALFVLVAVCLWAADFWQSKSYAEWSDKDVAKMVTDSPWAHRVNVPVGGSSSGMPSTSRRGARDEDAGGLDASMPNAGSARSATPSDLGLGAGDGERRSNRNMDDTMSSAAGQGMTLVVRWYTALPMKQALMRSKYGSEVKTSAEAKKFLERDEPNYVISVAGLPSIIGQGDQEKMKKAIIAQSSLTGKSGSPVKPSDVQIAANDKGVDAFFLFPKSTPFSLDDKDVEFSARIGIYAVKYKFHMKDMVFGGKLEL